MPTTFEKSTPIAAPADFAFAWHGRPGAFQRLSPPWEQLRIVRASGGIRDGGELEFKIRLAPGLWKHWHARHFGYVEGQQFCDEQVSGPFASWRHTHRFVPEGDAACRIEDHIEYALPMEPLSRVAPRCLVEDKIAAMFAYRSNVAQNDIARHWRAQLTPMRVALTGASGLVGTDLTAFLTTGGHSVVPLVRKPTPDGVVWNSTTGISEAELAKLEGVRAVVHLAGEPVMGVWTEEKKRRIRESRSVGTRALCESLARMKEKPEVLVCASAVGFYGSRGAEQLTEESTPGSGFLAEVAREWENACEPARAAGIRVVNLRIGIVLSPRGGALAAMRLPFTLGLGGRLGSGTQYMSWITADDLVGLIHHAIATPAMSGPVNAGSPNPATNAEFTGALSSALGSFVGMPAPAFVLRAAPGGMGDEFFLTSARMIPARALANGFAFAHTDLEAAFRLILGRKPTKGARMANTAS